jgi:NAD(P)-dependent dehydrogenase (short-subunit alcohol dehydrogenase family)
MKNPLNVDFTGKVVVITGAGGVLCSAIAKAVGRTGAKVALLGRTLSKLQAVEEAIRAEGGIAGSYACDVLDKEGLEKVHEKILADFGTCDILLNGAGGNNPIATTDQEFYTPDCGGKTFFDLDKKGVEDVFSLNFMGTLLPSQVFAKDMIGKEGCSIINISSMNAYTPLTKIPAYSGAKAAISNFTQWMATYFSKAGIRCNAIAPGFFSTEQNHKLLYNEDGSLSERSGKILRNTPTERFGKPEELVGAVLFLMSEEASGFINGVIIPIDGGFCAYAGV